MRTRYHIPVNLQWRDEPSSEQQRTQIHNAITTAIRRAVESSGAPSSIVSGDVNRPESLVDLFTSERYRPDRDTYAIPSYDEGGRPREVPLSRSARRTSSKPTVTFTKESILAHIQHIFGTHGPRGQTYYGVQTPDGVYVVDSEGGLALYVFRSYEKRSGQWVAADSKRYQPGQYRYTVKGKAPGGSVGANVGVVTDFQGQQYGEPVYSDDEAGFQIVFDVPSRTAPSDVATVQPDDGGRRSRYGIGIMNRGSGSAIIYVKCGGYWNTNPLTDPAYAGASDDDYWALFLNLCQARAITNLDISEKYIRDELVGRFLGPRGSTKSLSAASRQNVQDFQEDLKLLRGLMLASNKLASEIEQLQKEVDALTLTKRGRQGRTFFGTPLVINVYPSTYHEPAPKDRPRWELLTAQLEEKWGSAKLVTAAILRLVQQDPFLTQFLSGLNLENNVVHVPDRDKVDSTLADLQRAEEVQQEILEKLNETLNSIARARHKLCVNPERILDVPLVYQAVQKLVNGINPRFDKVVQERIVDHHKEEAWIDIGLSALGLALFVGGLILSLAGGPAGVILFLEVSGTALAAVQAARSLGKAEFMTSAAEASVLRGGGLVTLEAASKARFWAGVDAVLLGVDAGVQAIRLARIASQARKAAALAEVSQGVEKFAEAEEAARFIPFDELLQRATPQGKLPISADELTRLKSLGPKYPDTAVAGRIAEEAAERAVATSGDYVTLATKYQQGNLKDVGIDLLYTRRKIFEAVFGKLANPKDAARVFTQASEAQRQKFLEALRKRGNADDLVSVEVKFSRAGFPIEELLLSPSRGGIQQNTVWYRDLMAKMLQANDAEVNATGRLLMEVIGSNAQDLGRLSRIGIVVDVNGAFTLQRLSDPLIKLGDEVKNRFAIARFRASDLLKAEHAGKEAKADNLRAQLVQMNIQMDALDLAVKQAKQAELASQRALAAMQEASKSLSEVAVLSAQPRTPAVLIALHNATAAARLYLQVAKYSGEEADTDLRRSEKVINEAKNKFAEFEATIKALAE